MPLNLVLDPWIPVRLRDGTRRVVRPDEVADPAVLFPDWPRPDLNLACVELLVGFVLLADPPEGERDWDRRRRPDPARLRERLLPLAPTFELDGEGPRFLQDLERIEGEAGPPDMLFIDAAGENTARNNADLMVRRGRYPALDLPTAAMALYALQAHAPSGGAGNRTSMRGGGPLVTLVDPGEGLWGLVWANVPDGRPAGPEVLPWTRPTRVSTGDAQVWPGDAHPVEAFFGMPRRLRLVVADGLVTGVVQRPWGTSYAGWTHPLTPYHRLKPGSERLPVHPRAGAFGYRNWLGVVLEDAHDPLRERAATVASWGRRSDGERAALLVAGWAMDNMKPRDLIFSRQPLVPLREDAALLLRGMVRAAEAFGGALRSALKPIAGEGSALDALREAFFVDTQGAFEQRMGDLAGDNRSHDEVARAWLADLRGAAMAIFDRAAMAGLDGRETDVIARVVAGRSALLATFAGRTKLGREAFVLLDLAVPPKPPAKPKEPA